MITQNKNIEISMIYLTIDIIYTKHIGDNAYLEEKNINTLGK